MPPATIHPELVENGAPFALEHLQGTKHTGMKKYQSYRVCKSQSTLERKQGGFASCSRTINKLMKYSMYWVCQVGRKNNLNKNSDYSSLKLLNIELT